MKPITGSIVALVTPMHDDGSVDYRRAAPPDRLARRRRHATASAWSAPPANRRPSRVEEHCEIIRVAVEHARGPRARSWPAPAATPPPRRSSCRASRKKVGADCTLSVVPYYNKPSQEGIYRALQRHRRGGRHPDGALQRARPHRRRHAARDRAAPGAGARHRRHQGSHRQHRARQLADQRRAEGLLDLLGRRRHRGRADAARRPRQRQRHGQRRAARDAGAVRGRARRRRARGARRAPAAADAAAQAAVRRAEPGADQVGAGAPRPLRRGAAPADPAARPQPARPPSSRRCAKPACRDADAGDLDVRATRPWPEQCTRPRAPAERRTRLDGDFAE